MNAVTAETEQEMPQQAEDEFFDVKSRLVKIEKKIFRIEENISNKIKITVIHFQLFLNN